MVIPRPFQQVVILQEKISLYQKIIPQGGLFSPEPDQRRFREGWFSIGVSFQPDNLGIKSILSLFSSEVSDQFLQLVNLTL